MFKGLTQRAQKVLTILAQEEAKRFHSEQLLPEHVILSLLKDGQGVAVKALQKAKIDIGEMQLEIEKSLPIGKGGLILGDVPPSRRGKKILEESAEGLIESLGDCDEDEETVDVTVVRKGKKKTFTLDIDDLSKDEHSMIWVSPSGEGQDFKHFKMNIPKVKKHSIELFKDGNKFGELKLDKLRKEIEILEKRLEKLEKELD